MDPLVAAFKMAEMMVDLREMAGYPAVSRRGQWKKQPVDEFAYLRDWPANRPSIAAYYREVPAGRP